MRRRHRLALLFFLLPTLAALPGCGDSGAPIANNANTAVNTNTNTRINANATPRPLGTPDSKVDAIKEAMGVGSIAFNVPPSMRLEETQTIMLLLSPQQTAEVLEQELRGRKATGDIQKHTIKVGDQMQAELTGDGFQITPITPAQQPVSKREPTRWKWDVRPLRAGTLKLNVVLNAVADLKDGAGMRQVYIDSFDQVYVVEVPSPSPLPVAAAPARSGGLWPWLLPAVLVPAGGAAAWLLLRGRRGRRRVAPRRFYQGAGESKIFLSYRRDDTAGHSGRLRDALAERFGPERVFMDLESIGAGEDFVEVVKKAVDATGVVVVVIGRQWLSASDKKGNRRLDNPDDFVRLEVETALGRGVRVIPALVQGAEMPGEDALPESLSKLARRNAIEISDARWAFDVERLADAIEEALAQEPAERSEAGASPA
jgi:hypothetical protein